jgi:hypothetical protein
VTHTHSVALLWASDRSVLETSSCQLTQETDIHVHGEIRTRNSSKQAATNPRLSPSGHQNQHPLKFPEIFNDTVSHPRGQEFFSNNAVRNLKIPHSKFDVSSSSVVENPDIPGCVSLSLFPDVLNSGSASSWTAKRPKKNHET